MARPSVSPLLGRPGRGGAVNLSADDAPRAFNGDRVRESRTHRRGTPVGAVVNVTDRARGRISADVQRFGLTTVAFASSGATTLIFNLVLVRALSASAYGGVARTFALGMAVAQLTMAGVSPAIARRVAHGDDDDDRFSRARGGIRALGFSCWLVSLMYFPLAFVGLAPTSVLSLLLGWALAFVYASYFGLKLLLFVLDWSARYAVLEFASDAVFFITLALLAVLSPTAGVMTFSLAYTVFIVVATRLISRRGRRVEHVSVDRSIMKYAGWASVATYASIGRFTGVVVLTGVLAGSVTAGQLTAVVAIIMPFFLVPQAAAMLTFADVARARGADANRRVRTMCRVSGWVSAFTTITCCLFAHEAVRILLGTRYELATREFVILILCLPPQMLASPIGNALAAQGSVMLTASVSIAAFVIMLVGVLLLVPLHGLLGAAIAFGLSMLVGGLWAIAIGCIRFRLGLWEVAGTAIGVGLGLVALEFNGTSFVARLAGELVLVAAAGLGFLWMRRRRVEPMPYP